jgi:hypothetical protein
VSTRTGGRVHYSTHRALRDVSCQIKRGNELLIQIKALCQPWRVHATVDWKPISIAPFDRNLELAAIDRDGPHTLVFPCRRILSGWAKVETKERIDVLPTHWRAWVDKP